MLPAGQPKAPHDHLLAERIARWSRESIGGKVEVVDQSAGSWTASPDCSAPRLWLFLYGHYRTFYWTQPNLASMARGSSGGCFMTAAVLPLEVCVRNQTDPESCARGRAHAPLDWRLFARTMSDTPALLRAASTSALGRRMAHLVLRRSGELDAYPKGALIMPWHLLWALAEWAASVHGFRTAPNAVVLRTRPDAIYRAPFDLTRLSDYFAHGWRECPPLGATLPTMVYYRKCNVLHTDVCPPPSPPLHPQLTATARFLLTGGRHLILGQTMPSAQSDVQLITSYACYSNDIALALQPEAEKGHHTTASSAGTSSTPFGQERAAIDAEVGAVRSGPRTPLVQELYERGLSNGWGYAPPPGKQSCICAQPLRASVHGAVHCRVRVCHATVVESGSVLHTHHPQELLREPPLTPDQLWFNRSAVRVLADNVKCFCRDWAAPPVSAASDSPAINPTSPATVRVQIVTSLRTPAVDPNRLSARGRPPRRIQEYNVSWQPGVRWYRCVDGATLDPQRTAAADSRVWPAGCGAS